MAAPSSSSNVLKMRDIPAPGYERVVFGEDLSVGLRSIVAIHSTKLGPSLGGCRFFDYPSEEAGLSDVLKLAKAMTYKASLAGLNLGGGKSIIFGDPTKSKTDALLRSFGKFVDQLAGKYITTEDSGTSPADMDIIRASTKYVGGASKRNGGSGDPSPITAMGVFEGIRAAAEFVFGSSELRGKKISIQGMGHVGLPLARHLHSAGAHLIVTDRNQEHLEMAIREVKAETVGPDEIFSVPSDIFAPCAMGGILNEKTIPKLKCKIVAGAANNQLASPRAGEMLAQRNIAYAPDFAINAGGLISVGNEILGNGSADVERKTKEIYQTIKKILTLSAQERVSTATIADRLAEERLAK